MNSKEYLQSLIDSLAVSDRKIGAPELKLLQRLLTLDTKSEHYGEITMKIGDLYLKQVFTEISFDNHMFPQGYFASMVEEMQKCMLRAYTSSNQNLIRVSVESLQGIQLDYALGLAMNTGQPVKLVAGVIMVGDAACHHKDDIEAILHSADMSITLYTLGTKPIETYLATFTTESGKVSCAGYSQRVAMARCYVKTQLGDTVQIPLEVYNHV